MLVKVHHAYREVIAICDTSLLGKKFGDEKRQVILSEQFFKGEEKSHRETGIVIKEGFQEDATFTLVGEETINLALEEGLIQKESIITIQKIPVALVLL